MSDATTPAPPTGPADTNDPTVRVSSTRPDNAAAAAAGVPTAPAAVQLPKQPEGRVQSRGRTETYSVTTPSGQVLKVVRDLDTGRETITDADSGERFDAGARDDAPRTTV